MKSAQMIVGIAVLIAASVICGTEGIPRPQDLPNDYVEVDGFAFDGPVDRTRHTTTPRTRSTVRPTIPRPVTPIPSARTTPTPRPTPTPTPTDSPVTRNVVVDQCVQSCRFRVTSEYNPVCGTDGTVYNNPGMLRCARACGRNVGQAYLGPCTSNIRG